jgi:Zinc-binding dehydrogenase
MVFQQGLRDIGQVKPGETLVVSGAAGSVGFTACQLGKRAGAKVYAIAGSPGKCEWLEKEIGVDKAFNYKSPTFRQEFKKIGYLDVYFDNVGGTVSCSFNSFATHCPRRYTWYDVGEAEQECENHSLWYGLAFSVVSLLFICLFFRCNFWVRCVLYPWLYSGVDTRSLLEHRPTGLRNYQNIITQRAKMQGFIM